MEIKVDKNVEKNRDLLLQRSLIGILKYGATTDENPLSLRDWLQHALEEALDMANYLQAAIGKLDAKKPLDINTLKLMHDDHLIQTLRASQEQLTELEVLLLERLDPAPYVFLKDPENE